MHLSIIIPAYNEEKRLPLTLIEIDKYLSKQAYDYEIIVVSDGSKDKTAAKTREMAVKIKGLRLLDFKQNRGKGFVIRAGMLEASGNFRIFTDADNSTSIDQIEKMWPFFKKGYQVVIGSRDAQGAVLDPPQPWLRKVLFGKGFKLFRKIVVGLWEVKDTQCGFKGFTKEAAEKIFSRCRIDRFAFDPEALMIAEKSGYAIKEIPIYWQDKTESKVNFKSIIKMAWDMFKIRLYLIKNLYEKETE